MQEYNAKLNIGKRKVCPDMFLDKIAELPVKEIFYGSNYVVGALIALWIFFSSFLLQFMWITDIIEPEMGQEIEELGVRLLFTDFVFPIIYMKCFYNFFKERSYIWEESHVQIA